jgi:hypothetical protein
MLRSLVVTGARRVSFEEGAFDGCPMLTSVNAPGRFLSAADRAALGPLLVIERW